ncbi:single-stranded DNA-binding protein [Streptomyces cavernicola]|uniref:Single-stranded DNA-binding protein n=1 Tax=Streptomyces cavernicola TaxID=3043613 RepID=A0ABT6S850_9ACTN|nr:single-stranded DNA-binding protein [Streptomyces sp. B-S-A6]MDI3404281.1 single-stranded DNA-binding protein [Streptomyces sp. B-S-A6]
MNETMVTLVGNVATKPVFRETPNGPVVRFRLAMTSRFFDRATQGWKDGHTNFFTVWAWRTLAANVASSVSVGEPLLVRGRLKVRSEERGGQAWTSADIEASAVGHDLSRGTSAFRRTGRVVTESPARAAQAGGAGTEGSPDWSGAVVAGAASDPMTEHQDPLGQPVSGAQLADQEPKFELPAPGATREPEPAG